MRVLEPFLVRAIGVIRGQLLLLLTSNECLPQSLRSIFHDSILTIWSVSYFFLLGMSLPTGLACGACPMALRRHCYANKGWRVVVGCIFRMESDLETVGRSDRNPGHRRLRHHQNRIVNHSLVVQQLSERTARIARSLDHRHRGRHRCLQTV